MTKKELPKTCRKCPCLIRECDDEVSGGDYVCGSDAPVCPHEHFDEKLERIILAGKPRSSYKSLTEAHNG